MTKDEVEQVFCIAHTNNPGPFNKDSELQKEHESKTNGKCKWETYNPQKYNRKYSDSKIDSDHVFYFVEGDRQITQNILDKKIQTLRPQTLLSDGTKFILVYLPTRQEIIKGTGEKITKSYAYANSAYFVISRPQNSESPQREILPYNNDILTRNYKLNVLSEWNDIRWDVTDVKKWEFEDAKTDPTVLYHLIDTTTRKYLEFASESEYVKFNLWNIGTYFFELFDVYPYNDYTGTKRAGKTKSLEFQKLVCFNSVMSADITSSAIFRIIEGTRATVLLDETESFKDKKNEQAQAVRNILMQGFIKDQFAVRNEASKDRNFTPTQFNLYSPKSLAHINAFDDVLEERCIQQVNQRALDEKIRNTWPTEQDESFEKIRNLCYRLFLDHADEINHLKSEARKLLSVNSRELQLWTPIITMALFFQKHGIKNLTNAIQISVSESSQSRQIDDEQDSRDLRILKFLEDHGIGLAQNKELTKGNPLGWIPIGVLASQLLQRKEYYEINPEYFSRKTLTETLKKLGFKQEKKQAGYSWFIVKSAVDEVKKRMGIVGYGSMSLDTFGSGLDSVSDASDASELGIKSSDSPGHFDLKTSDASDLSVLSMRKSKVNEQNEASEPISGHGISDSIEHKSEVLNQSELFKLHTTSDTSDSKLNLFKCVTHNAGPFSIDAKSGLGSILEFHKKLGCQIEYGIDEP